MPYDPKNYSFGLTRLSDHLRPQQKIKITGTDFADLERRTILWMQMKEGFTGGPANQVGDHDPDYVPGLRDIREKKDDPKGMDSTRSDLDTGRGNVPASARRLK